ncbi:MAG: HU family DNA-binding protein [Chitinispirillales bacterium]|jgi:nucleoid DNA-binding protein|nr:HU family DNA-binding protein [Chitinispirillales bacterium]
MPSVKKIDLGMAVAKETGLTAIDAKIVINALIESLSDTLIAENTVELRGFGTFSVTKRMPRTARNMITGEKIKISARKDITMKPCQTFKNMVNDSLSKKSSE